MPKQSKTTSTSTSTDGAHVKKWGKHAIAAGYTVIPNILLEKIHALSLDPVDVCILLILAKHWWNADESPFPSKETIATAIGKTPRHVQRRITYLEELQFVEREKRRSAYGTNTYHLAGLVKVLNEHAQDSLRDREQRKKEKKISLGRKLPRGGRRVTSK